ncbi:hypothetical protein [Rhodoferax ferrireducens]|uniref:hypothetical protein n=1 Tax=Rhodoferax ferrireducens TaxID=192843 RepID=UPI000E0DC394|nr:hypothetical protein [Rhodoferax ferrireducens]
MSTRSSLLTPDLIAMVDGGVSTIVSSCDAALHPSVMRAVGSAITPDGLSISVYLSRRQSRQLLQDVAASGHIAVVFSQPFSHRTLQVKATSARTRSALPADQPVLQRYLLAMQEEVSRVGFDPAFTRAMLAYQFDDLVVISFEPTQAFDQTPGPKAGAALPGAASESAA